MADNYYRSQYARELEQFAELLVAYSVIQDPSPLYTAAGECRKSGIDGCWSYHLERLLIHNVVDTKKFPTDVSNISLELSISAVGYCEPEEGCDPFAELVLEIFIKGELANFEAEGHQLVYCSWYMDKHIIKGRENN